MLGHSIHATAVTLLAVAAALDAAAAAPEGGATPMTLIDANQKHAVEKSIAELSAASAAQAATTNRAVATLIGNQHSSVSVRGFSVPQDEPASVAGSATGPTPTDLFVAALGTCQNVVFVRYAALEQLAIEALETSVTGTWDRRGLYGIAGVDPGYQEIVIETRVSTPAPAAKVAEVARRTRAGCPIFATLRKETLLTVRLLVNGQPVPL
jgi:putative redox protein